MPKKLGIKFYEFDKPPSAKVEEERVPLEKGEIIFAMPKRFKKTKKISAPKIEGEKRRQTKWILISLAIFVVVLILLSSFVLWAKKYPKKEGKPLSSKIETPQIQQQPIEEKSEETLKVEIKNEKNEVVSWAEVYSPKGAIKPEEKIELKISSVGSDDQIYKIVAGTYNLAGPEKLNKLLNFKIFYHLSLVKDYWVDEIKLGYFKDGFWTPLESQLNKTDRIVSFSLEYLPSPVFALIVKKEKLIPEVEKIIIQTPSALDSDQDGLTDVEEGVFGTNPSRPDSDGGGDTDGFEIADLSNPLVSGAQETLAVSGLINVYTNSDFKYSFFYPKKWTVRPVPETENKEILIITNTAEFFSVLIEENRQNLDLVSWYLKLSPGVDRNLLRRAILSSGEEALWSPDGLNLYIGKGEKIYILTYDLGAAESANFKTAFKMMIKSWQFLQEPAEELPPETEEEQPSQEEEGTEPEGRL